MLQTLSDMQLSTASWDPNSTNTTNPDDMNECQFVFLSHGDKHSAFVQQFAAQLLEAGIPCYSDQNVSGRDFYTRIQASQQAILRCSCFVVLVSRQTIRNELVRDQLAFAEDKGRPIFPVVLNDVDPGLDKRYTLVRSELFHFMANGMGFKPSFDTLSNLAPSVTPRPVKPTAPAARGGRTYLLCASPIKLLSGNGDAKAQAVIRPAESPIPLTMRKKPLILSGDIRNLGSNFQLATARETLSLAHLGDVFAAHGIVITRAEAQALRHEFEENNERGLSYVDFVDELARSFRGPVVGTADTGRPNESSGLVASAACRTLVKKPQLAEHLSRLMRDACRAAETGAGKLSKTTFARVLTGLAIPPLPPAALEELSQDGSTIDYHEFLAQFGSSFQHGDTNNVSNSLVFDRPAGKPIAEVAIGTGANNITATNKTLQSPGVSGALGGHSPGKKTSNKKSNKLSEAGRDPVLLEQLRIVVGNRIKTRTDEVLSVFSALDPSDSGFVPAPVFTQALRDLRLVESEEETATVLYATVDGDNRDSVDYRKFVTSFGDVAHPRGIETMRHSLQENSSLIFTGSKEVKGAYKNRVALSSPGNELKEAFSRLPDASWRAIHVELELSDPHKSGLVPAAELLRVLSKHLGPLPSLVKSYRPRVVDTESFFASPLQGDGARELVSEQWSGERFKIVSRRVTHVDKTAFLCYFYEDRSIATDSPLIRYASFLRDYEDPGLESNDPNEDCKPQGRSKTTVASNGPSLGDTESDLGSELEQLRQFFRANIGALERMLGDEDSDKRGFVSLPVFTRICAKLSSEVGTKWRESRATAKLFARYIARGGQFYYRGFVLDMDGKVGLQAQALVVQEDDEDEERDSFNMDSIPKDNPLDVHEARAAIRHLMTSSRSQQSAVYKLLANMDPSGSGLLRYPELRRAFERLGVNLRDDVVVHELLSFYEEEDARGERTTGQVKYLQLLHALGGKDPDKVGKDSSMSDLSSHCSYYSAVGISPRAVRRSPAAIAASRQLTSRAGHVLAAQAVNHAVENPRAALNAGIGATAGAAAVEQKLQKALQTQGKTASNGTGAGDLLPSLSLMSPVKIKATTGSDNIPEALRLGVQAKWKEVYASFKTLDKNNSNRVSAAHFRQLLEWYALPITDTSFLAVLRAFDSDDGLVDYNRFMRACFQG
ncbi:hypothetical protein JG687_00009452 [Phytophthora cactorum]|uniref:EF-hand domain-containing protein n=1 Tax=Phytophthora cactorum TaxID=29920 RepID=A0A8T1U9M3_9STRA|nr:hypothetical protein JG687_00009452 [Phytophthora cactorum]